MDINHVRGALLLRNTTLLLGSKGVLNLKTHQRNKQTHDIKLPQHGLAWEHAEMIIPPPGNTLPRRDSDMNLLGCC